MSTSPRTGAPTTYRSLFAVAEFRVLWSAMLLHGLGFQLELVGLSVLVYARTASPLLTAATFGVGFLPQVVGGTLLTSLADRHPTRTVISAGLLVRAVPGLVVGLLPGLPLAVVFAVVAAAAALEPVTAAARSAVLPDLVDDDQYVLARSVASATSSSVQLVGLGLGGVLLVALPAPGLLVGAGVALTVAAAVARAGLRDRPARAPRSDGRQGVLRAPVAGNAALLRSTRLRGLLLAQLLPASFVTGAEALLVPYALASGASPGAASLLLAALPSGMLMGDLVVGRWCRPAPPGRLVRPLLVLMGLPLLGMAAHPPPALVAVLLTVAGSGFAYTLGLQRGFLDALPVERRGQGFALLSSGLMTGQGISPAVTGALTAAVSVTGVIAITGAATTLCTWLAPTPGRAGP